MRNGGRHCCQPPLRRALDLPVFPGSGPWGTSSHDPGAPAQASLLRKAAPPLREPFPRRLSHPSLEVRFSCRLRRRFPLPLSGSSFASAVLCRPLRAPSKEIASPCRLRTGPWSCDRRHLPFVPRPFLERSPRDALTVRRLSGVTQREERLFRRLLPALLWKSSVKSLPGDACFANSIPAPAGGDRVLRPLPVPPAPLRAPGFPAGASTPDHPCRMTPIASRTKRNRQWRACG